MYGPIIKYCWDDRCPECGNHVPITFSDKVTKCQKCGAELEIDRFTFTVRDLVIFIIVPFGADLTPMSLPIKIGAAVVILGVWFYKSSKWRKIE